MKGYQKSNLFSEELIHLVVLYRGFKKSELYLLKNGDYSKSHFWPSDIQTAIHYMEAGIVRVMCEINSDEALEYTSEDNIPNNSYACADVQCPKGARWYTFGNNYLETHVKDFRLLTPEELKYFCDFYAEEEE